LILEGFPIIASADNAAFCRNCCRYTRPERGVDLRRAVRLHGLSDGRAQVERFGMIE
jgi:hypothetical protein